VKPRRACRPGGGGKYAYRLLPLVRLAGAAAGVLGFAVLATLAVRCRLGLAS
jgi:hypothetical protein